MFETYEILLDDATGGSPLKGYIYHIKAHMSHVTIHLGCAVPKFPNIHSEEFRDSSAV